MIKALIKKQLLETFAFFTQNKGGKKRSAGAIVGMTAIVIIGLASICASIWILCDAICAPLAAQGRAWLYFAFMGLVATALGLVGSIFTAKTKLYEAKDNDLLLSMPISPWLVLFSRMVGLYLFTLLFEAVVLIPAIFCYFFSVEVSFAVLIGSFLTLLIIPFGTLAICCLLGWVLAWAEAKLPVKNLFAYIFSIGSFALIMWLEAKMNEYMGALVANSESVGTTVKKVLYPFYQMGRACVGEWLAILLVLLMFVGIFALVYLVLSKTYLRLATAKQGGKKKEYKVKGYKQGSLFGTLLKKEAMRYFKNPMIVMNCFLGGVFCIALPFIALFTDGLATELNAVAGIKGGLALICCIIVGACTSMNLVAASSVSLEGESLWVVRSLPVKTEQVFFAKLSLHFITAAIPAAIGALGLAIVFKVGVGLGVCMVASMPIFAALMALLDLTFNLLFPKLSWTNELVVVKQSASTLIGSFAGFGVVGLLVGGWFLFGKYLPAWGYLLVCCAIMAVACGFLVWFLKTKGKKIFEKL